MKRIGVIGVGSGGILSLCHFLTWLNDYQVVSIYDPNIPCIGIGESTNPFFLDTMSNAMGIDDFGPFLHERIMDSTIKHGTIFRDWREKEYLNPLFGDNKNIGIHFNTFKFKDFAFDSLKSKWGEKFQEIVGQVLEIQNNPDNIILNIDGKYHSFDYVIDCRGFPKTYENHVLLDMPINRGFINNSTEGNDWGYTLHQATENGWMFGVPLSTRTSYGYLFNDSITNVEDAKKDFSDRIGVPIDKVVETDYKFKSFYIKQLIKNRLIINGNSAFFLEPMVANSLFIYDYVNRLTYDYIVNGFDANESNYNFQQMALQMHDLICYYYHGGSKYDTDFWKYAVQYSSKRLKESLFFLQLKDRFRYMEENNCEINSYSFYSVDSLKKIDKNMEYYYWTKKE